SCGRARPAAPCPARGPAGAAVGAAPPQRRARSCARDVSCGLRGSPMNPMSRLHLFAALAGSFSLVACGGGGGSDVVPATAAVAGVYVGSGGSSRASAFAILDDGRYYLV